MQRPLRRPHRSRGLCGLIEQARVFLSGRSDDVQQRLATRDAGAAEALDFESGGADPRPDSCLVAGPRASGHPRRRGCRCRCHRRPSGRRTDLRSGLLLPGRPELGQPGLFPEPRPAALGRGGADLFCRPILRQPSKAPLVLLSHRLVEQDLVEEALSLRGRKVTLAVPQRGDKKKLVDRILRRLAKRSAGDWPRAPRNASCSTGSRRPWASTRR